VVDADQIAREVTAPGSPIVAEIVAAFGPVVAGSAGSLDRAALARIVFNDPAELGRLEAITHPAVRTRILADLRDAEAAAVPIVALEAIRLVDGGYPVLLDEVWLVTCDRGVQLERLAMRGLAPDDAAARIAAQASLVDRAELIATRVIDTSGSMAAAEAAVDAALAAASSRRPDAAR
jgi:dephospho-CoA kinase